MCRLIPGWAWSNNLIVFLSKSMDAKIEVRLFIQKTNVTRTGRFRFENNTQGNVGQSKHEMVSTALEHYPYLRSEGLAVLSDASPASAVVRAVLRASRDCRRPNCAP